jgi:NAD(P)-dependent dehydrogenase (short-subunit alcohol dehydrogenase family)
LTAPSQSPFRLDGKVAVVTGGARGIGYAIAVRMLEAGATVVLNDIDKPALADAVNRLSESSPSGRVVPFVGDVADRDDIRRLVSTTVDTCGSLDILVNNAGFYAPTPLEDLESDTVDRLLDVNVKGLLYLSAEAAAVMQPGSAIVHISSLGGVRPPFPGLTVYHATKGALDSMTRDMALSWGPRGIRVNSAAPGGIMTEGAGQVRDSPLYTAEEMAAITDRATNRPLGRMGCADDLATVVVFLASPAAGFITGQMILVDGGYYLA